MPIALVTPEALRHKSAPCVDILTEAGFKIDYPKDPTFTRGLCGEAETISQLSLCDAVIAGGEHFTRKVLASLPQLRVIARYGVGYDRVDVLAATDHTVAVTITPTANHECVAEQTLALMFAVARSVVTNDRRTRQGDWQRPVTQPLRGRTFGVFGLGRIGRSIATRVAALGMTVIAHEPYPDKEFVRENSIELVDFDHLLARSDYLSVHCPLNEDTIGLFCKATLAKMKPGSVLLNTARGKLVVETDLLEALNRGHLRGAGLDVFETEPTSPNNPLFSLDQVVLSPHIGGADWLSQENMGIEAAQSIVNLYRGEWPEDTVVNKELKDGWQWKR